MPSTTSATIAVGRSSRIPIARKARPQSAMPPAIAIGEAPARDERRGRRPADHAADADRGGQPADARAAEVEQCQRDQDDQHVECAPSEVLRREQPEYEAQAPVAERNPGARADTRALAVGRPLGEAGGARQAEVGGDGDGEAAGGDEVAPPARRPAR